MRPHTQNLDGLLLFKHLIHQSVLNIDAAGICAFQIPKEAFKRRRGMEGGFLDDCQKLLHFLCKGRSSQLLCIPDCILCVHESVVHGFLEIDALCGARDRFSHAFSYGISHSWYREEVERFLDRSPVLLGDEDGVALLSGNENGRTVFLESFDEAVEPHARVGGGDGSHTFQSYAFPYVLSMSLCHAE